MEKNYTFTMPCKDKGKFNNVLSRLDDSEYTLLTDWTVNHDNDECTVVMCMDEEAALTFRFGVKGIKIRHERTEEELAEEKRLADRHKISIVLINQ